MPRMRWRRPEPARDVSIAHATALPRTRNATLDAGADRDARIDAAKAAAIVLVVLGHAKGMPGWFALAVFSFHVPAFFVLSGWLAARRADQGPRALAPRLARSLLLPYAAFFFAGYAYWLLTRQIGEKAGRWGAVPWWDPLAGFLGAIPPQLYVNPALWFLPAIFVTVLAHALLRRVLPARALALLSLAFAVVWTMLFPVSGLRLPFALDMLPVALAFYAIGAAAAGTRMLPRSPAVAAVAALALAPPWLLLVSANGYVNLAQLRFGASGWMYAAAALLGTAMLMSASVPLARMRVVQWIGRNTLLILCTHMLVFFVLSGVASLGGVFDGRRPGPAWAVFAALAAIALCVPMRAVLLRHAPWALGLRAAAREAPT